MTTYNTGNPLGSTDPRDLYDNAQNLDELVNSESKQSHPDRLGVPRKTWHGMEQEFDADQTRREGEHQGDQARREGEFQADQTDRAQRWNLLLANSGYEYLADYAAGVEVTEYNQVIRDTGGEFWRVSGSTELPYTTDGSGLPEGGAFVTVGDAALRQELAAENGALLVRGSVIYVDTIADLQALPTSELVDGQEASVSGSSFRYIGGEWSLSGEHVTVEAYSDQATATDWAPAFRAAVQDGYGKILATRSSYDFETRVDNIKSGTIIDLNGAEVVWKGTGLGTLSDAIFKANGVVTTTEASVASTTLSYGQEIELVSNPFSAGDYVQVDPTGSASTSVYAQYVFRVDRVSGNFIYSNYPLFLPIYSDGAVIKKLEPVVGASILNATMRAEGQTSRSVGIGAISFDRSVNCYAENITGSNFWFKACRAWMSIGAHFKDIFTYEPAATGGGEGYGVQFEFSYQSGVNNSRAFNARHSVDFTASGYCFAKDCYSSNSPAAGFLTHKAAEYEILFENCHSFRDDSGFALGSLNSGFADITDRVKLKNCSATEFNIYALTYIQKGRGLDVDGFKATPRNPSTYSGNAVTVSNADVSLRGLDVSGKVRVDNPEGAAADGFANIYDSILKDLPSNRALSAIRGGKFRVYGSDIIDRIEILTSGEISLYGCNHIAETGNPFGQDGTGVVSYFGGTLRFGELSQNYLKPSRLILSSCRVSRVNSGATIINTRGRIELHGDCGDIRIVATGGSVSLRAARIEGRITTSNFSGQLIIVGSYVQGRVENSGTGGYRANVASSEFGENLILNSAGSGHIVDNWITGTATLPSATGTLIVRDNVS